MGNRGAKAAMGPGLDANSVDNLATVFPLARLPFLSEETRSDHTCVSRMAHSFTFFKPSPEAQPNPLLQNPSPEAHPDQLI
jgi:hypothetical protein